LQQVPAVCQLFKYVGGRLPSAWLEFDNLCHVLPCDMIEPVSLSAALEATSAPQLLFVNN
jgi:hypothetical protein